MSTWNPQANSIFLNARDLTAGSHRDAYLDGACGGDSQLRAEVESLLEASGQASGFLESRAGDLPTGSFRSVEIERPGDQVGPYKLLQEIGEGGMGLVFLAEQTRPVRRTVALKIIKPGMDTRQVIARFEAERQALALMDHPNIAKVFDGGTTENGRPYFVMELVKGIPITKYCDEHRLTVGQRLELFVPVCQAIQHAHQKGIIHRDLKPSNVLIAPYDGRPVPKVIDFGVAKAAGQPLTERTLFTELGAVVGTLEYMSPEQAELNQLDVDTRSDIYSLGVLLYELLSGTTPFDRKRLKSSALNEVLRIIREEDPPKPSTRISAYEQLPSIAAQRNMEPKQLTATISGELDWIVMKALEKDRNRRYESSASFAADIGRYLNNDAVVAAPPSTVYRWRKFLSRNRRSVAFVMTVASILIASVVIVSMLALKLSERIGETKVALNAAESARSDESKQRQEADRQRAAAEQSARTAQHELAYNQAVALKNELLFDQALDRAKEAYKLKGGWSDGLLLDRIVGECRRNWELEHIIPLDRQPDATAIVELDGKPVLLCVLGNRTTKYDLQSERVVATASHKKLITLLVPFRGTAKRIVAVHGRTVSVISLNDLSTIATQDFDENDIEAIDTGESEIAITFSDKTIHVLSDKLEPLGTVIWPPQAKLSGNQPLRKLAISPDGRWVVASGISWANDCLIWDRKTKTTTTQVFFGQSLVFADPLTLYAVLNRTGPGIELGRYTFGDTKVRAEYENLGDIPKEDLGNALRPVATKNRIQLLGELGPAILYFPRNRDSLSRLYVLRFTSIFGRTDLKPVPSCMDTDGKRIAVVVDNALWVIWRRELAKASHTRDMCQTLGASALYALRVDDKSLLADITPAGPLSTSATRQLAPVSAVHEGWNVIGCGIAVSQDQKTIAVRLAESDKLLDAGDQVENHTALIFRDSNQSNSASHTLRPTAIRLIEQGTLAFDAAHDPNRRIFELSPDGRYLLVGTRAESGSSAELYECETGRLVKRWFADDVLGMAVATIPGADCFADISPRRTAIRLISWANGNVEREITTAGPIAWLAASADARDVVVSIDRQRIERYDVDTGEKVGELKCSLLPLSWCSSCEVFIGYQVYEASSRDMGSIVLAKASTGEVTSILQKNMALGYPARLSADGRALMYPTVLGGYQGVLARNLTPESSNARLAQCYSEDGSATTSSRVAERIRLFESQQSALEARKAEDLDSVRQHLGESTMLTGRVVAVSPTFRGDSLNILLAPVEKGLLLWLPRSSKPRFDAAFSGDVAKAIRDKKIVVTGRIGSYGGTKEEWRGRLQLELKDVDQLKIVSESATETPSK